MPRKSFVKEANPIAERVQIEKARNMRAFFVRSA